MMKHFLDLMPRVVQRGFFCIVIVVKMQCLTISVRGSTLCIRKAAKVLNPYNVRKTF